MILLTVSPGEEVIETLMRKAAEAGVTDGAIVSLIGEIGTCLISVVAKDGEDVSTKYSQPFELTGTGEIRDGQVHMHVVLGRADDTPIVGHLRRAMVDRRFVHAYVMRYGNQE